MASPIFLTSEESSPLADDHRQPFQKCHRKRILKIDDHPFGLSKLYLLRKDKNSLSETLTHRVNFYKRLGKNFVIKQKAKNLMEPLELFRWTETQKFLLNLPRNPYVCSIDEILEDDKFFYVIMPDLNGPNLWQSINSGGGYSGETPSGDLNGGRLDFSNENVLKKLFKNLLKGVKFLHSNGVVHGDLKLENAIFHGNGQSRQLATLIDFDTCLLAETGAVVKIDQIVGTRTYAAPECFKKLEISHLSDMFSLGVIFYILVTKEHPFGKEKFMGEVGEDDHGGCCEVEYGKDGQDIAERKNERIYQKVFVEGKIEWKEKHFSPMARDLCQRLLSIEAKDRLNCEEALSHVWFNEKEAL